MELTKFNLMDKLNDVHEDRVAFADDQRYFVDKTQCDNDYVLCRSYYDNTSRYTGQWKNMMPHGRGTIIMEIYDSKNGGLEHIYRYDGMWKKGVPCGRGRVICIYFRNRNWNQLIEGEFGEKGKLAAGCSRR